MDISPPKPITGIGVMIFKDGKILLGKRKGAHAAGTYASPGGKLDHLESFENCVRRETREECGIEIKNIRFQFLANLIEYTPNHYTHIGLIADWESGEPQLLEPEKCEGWSWYDLNNLPKPLFQATHLFMDSLHTGRVYYDSK